MRPKQRLALPTLGPDRRHIVHGDEAEGTVFIEQQVAELGLA